MRRTLATTLMLLGLATAAWAAVYGPPTRSKAKIVGVAFTLNGTTSCPNGYTAVASGEVWGIEGTALPGCWVSPPSLPQGIVPPITDYGPCVVCAK